MGLGIGIDCDGCGRQIGYDYAGFVTREDGYDVNACGKCMADLALAVENIKAEWAAKLVPAMREVVKSLKKLERLSDSLDQD